MEGQSKKFQFYQQYRYPKDFYLHESSNLILNDPLRKYIEKTLALTK